MTDYPAEGHANEVFPGQDYSNPRVKDFLSGKRKKKNGQSFIQMCLFIFNLVAQYDLTLVDRNITPRMPWHDMTVGMVSHTIKILVLIVFILQM